MILNGTTTLGHLIREAEAIHDHTYDEIIPADEISFQDFDNIRIGSESYPLLDTARVQIASKLNVPYGYIRGIDADLAAINLNRNLHRIKGKNLLFRFMDSEVRCILSSRYKILNQVEVLDDLRVMFGVSAKVKARFDDNFMSVSFIYELQEFDIAENDSLIPGLSIGNSETGLAPISVSLFIYRVICQNGLINKSSHSLSRRHIRSDLLEDLPSLIEQAKLGQEKLKDQLRISLTTKVDNPEASLERMNRQFGLNDLEKKSVIAGYQMEPGDNFFSLVNAYTRGAQDPSLSAHSANRLEKVGGLVLNMVRH